MTMIAEHKQALRNISRSLIEQEWLKFLKRIITNNKYYDMNAKIANIFEQLSKHPKGVSFDQEWSYDITRISINILVDSKIIFLKLDALTNTSIKIIPTKLGAIYINQWNLINNHKSYRSINDKYSNQALVLLVRLMVKYHLCVRDPYGQVKHQLTHGMFQEYNNASLSERVQKSLAGDPDMLEDTLSGTIDYAQASLDNVENQEDLQQDHLESDIKSLLHHVFRQNDHEH